MRDGSECVGRRRRRIDHDVVDCVPAANVEPDGSMKPGALFERMSAGAKAKAANAQASD